ncbi:carbon starvation induced protein [compost metagenome]
MSESLEGSHKKVSIPVPVGSFVLVNNMFWLHGRDRFTAHPGLRRELMRQRGYISYQKPMYQRGQ